MGYFGTLPPADMIQDTKKDIYEFTATNAQTLFTGFDDNAKALSYTAGQLMVALNGVWLDDNDYTASNGIDITLTSGAITGQSLKVLTFDSYDVLNTYTKKQVDDLVAAGVGTASTVVYEYTATASQTTFTGVDDNADTLSYIESFILVIMNGVVLDSSEYTATDETSVVLSSGANGGDIVNILSFGTFNIANMYTKIEANNRYINKLSNDSIGATEQEWIEVNLNGTVGYIRVYATK